MKPVVTQKFGRPPVMAAEERSDGVRIGPEQLERALAGALQAAAELAAA